MIDATKSPTPTWKRYGTMVLLALLIVAAAYIVWTKELHHSSPSTSAPKSSAPVATAPVATGSRSKGSVTKTPSTTVPGGVAVSRRNPFGP
jgi:multidrug resistance efflux pump